MRLIAIHPQLQQMINLSLLLVIGKNTAHLYLSWVNICVVLIFTLFIEHVFIYLKDKKLSYFSFSALSTAIGVMLMMASPHLWIYMIVIGLGLLQKHFLVVHFNHKKRHFFNPSNFALLAGLLLFYHQAHIVIGQLGNAMWVEAVVCFLALLVLVKVDRWVIPVVFSVSYLLFQYFIVTQNDPVLVFEELYLRFYSVSFIVFILFMLTDPKTTPEKHQYQLLFAISVALTATVFDYVNGFRVQHLFLSLSIFSVCMPIFEFTLYKGQTVSEANKSRLLIKMALLLMVLIGVIVTIQQKQPYYFSMDA